MAQINVKVPRDTKELAKKQLDHGGLSERVRQELEWIAHGEEVSEKKRLKDRLEDLRSDRQEKKVERANLDREIDELNRKIERVEDQLDSLRDKEGEYEGALQMIEESMREDGMRVFEGHGQIKEAASIGDCSQQTVIQDLQERNGDLPEGRFEQGTVNQPSHI